MKGVVIKNKKNRYFIKNLIFIPTVNKQYYWGHSKISSVLINELEEQNDKIGKQQSEIDIYRKEVSELKQMVDQLIISKE